MKSSTMIGWILELLIKIIGVAFSFLLFPISFTLQTFSKNGSPDQEMRGISAMLDGWFKIQVKSKPIDINTEIDVIPIVHNIVLDIIDKVHGTHIANSVYTDSEILTDVKLIADQVKEAL